MSEYKCPTCGASASIDKKKRKIVIRFSVNVPKRIEPFKPPITTHFPSHIDCELGKPVDKINLKRLERVDKPEGKKS